jgi:hypothetical protein
MKAVLIFFLLIIVNISLLACPDNCVVSSTSWKSEKEAIDGLEKADFLFSESFNNESESWLLSASFYSCNGQNGYLIIHSQKKGIQSCIGTIGRMAGFKKGQFQGWVL